MNVLLRRVGWWRVGLASLKTTIPYTQGDVLFFRSAVLEHWVAPFIGASTCFIFFTKKDIAGKFTPIAEVEWICLSV
jgi:hypothetical protein